MGLTDSRVERVTTGLGEGTLVVSTRDEVVFTVLLRGRLIA